jgi:hypothetical protein
MAESFDTLMREFLTWVADRRRSYDDAMEAWQSHCPRQTIWEDAIIGGYIRLENPDSQQESQVVLTPQGQHWLEQNRNHN